MCGRFTIRAAPQVLKQEFDLFDWPSLQPQYNIAPTQQVPIIRLHPGGSQREVSLLRWGLVPSWAPDLKTGARMFNARAETVAAKPAFRSAFKARRCLVPTDGFYEWKKGAKPKDPKQPFLIHLQSDKPFAMAGLWECWQPGEVDKETRGQGDKETHSSAIETFTIITTEANQQVRELHDRMPVILAKKDYETWLNLGARAPRLLELLKPSSEESLVLTPMDPLRPPSAERTLF
jgi:putative SOS response-associated peptidase YedK